MAKKVTQKDIKENTPVKTGYVAVDMIAIFFVVVYLAMDFIPFTNGVDNVGIQYLYLAIVNLITGIYLFRNPQLISKEYFGLFRKSNAIKAYILFLTLCGLSIVVSSHYSLSIISFTQLLITFCLFINISILLHNRLHLINKIAFVFIVIIFLQCFFEIKHFVELANSNSLSVALRHLTGNTGSINIFAANLATKIPFLLFGILTFSKFKKWLSIVALFLASLLILLTASRASILGLSIEVIVFMIFLFKIDSITKDRFKLIATIIISFIFSYFTANLILDKSNDTHIRFQSVGSRVGQITNINEASANKRLDLWSNAIEIAKHNPTLGIGLGNWLIESIPHEKYMANELNYSIHTHNDFLEIAAETGILNGIVFLLVFIFATFINVKRILKNNDAQVKVLSIITLLMIITYGIDSVFNFPLHRPTMQYNLALILAFTLVNIPKMEQLNYAAFTRKGILILIIICAGTTFFSYQLYHALVFENEITTDYKLPEAEQTLSSTYIEENMPKFIDVNLNAVPFYEFLGKYYLKEKQYAKANTCFNLSEKINPYSGNSDFFRNKIAQEKGLIDSAHIYAKRALTLRPRNEIYFYETINTAILKKDTVDILKLHYKFIKLRNEPRYWINTSSALIISNCSYKNAVKFIDEGLKVFPNDASLVERRNSFEFDVLIKKALQLENEKKYLAAIEIYKEILDKDRKNSTALQNISTCYINLKNYKQAIYYLEKTLKFSKDDDGKFAFRLGVCYYSINDKEKGCYYIDQAVLKNYPNAINIKDKYCN